MSGSVMNVQATSTDIAIIGAGPVGLFAIFQCGMLGLSCHVVDVQSHVGGQCMALYPEKPIYDIPAFSSITAAELIERLAAQAAVFEPVYHLGNSVSSLQQTQTGRWLLVLSSGVRIEAGAVIIASGAGLLCPNKPALPGLDEYEGCSVHYSVRNKSAFAGRHVVIAGGGDSAADWAVELESIAASVTCIHRRPVWRAAPHTQAQLETLAQQGRLRLLAPAQMVSLHGQGGVLEAVGVIGNGNGVSQIRCEQLLLFYGLANRSGPFASWGLVLQEGRIAINAKSCATNLPGIFAAGDAAYFPGKLNLILSGFSEAATSARNAFRYSRPTDELFVEHSTARAPGNLAPINKE